MAERRFVLEPLAEIAPDWALEDGTVTSKSAALKKKAADQICVLDEAATRRFASLRSA